jgi:hypothetical protein
MFDDYANNSEMVSRMDTDYKYQKLKDIQRKDALRFTDMQQVVNAKLMASQQSVDNAQNYPSTWSTNPDGGANGQV